MTDKITKLQTPRRLTQQRKSSIQVSTGQEKVDLLPNEQDQAISKQPTTPRKIMTQAAIDVARGLKDTDRGVEIGKTYAKQKT